MAPPPEYDKEPKAPDKSASSISTEDSKLLHNLVNDQHTNSDHKSTNTVTAIEVENKKHIETLDDGQLKALLDEAINYKNPKDREGKSDIFKELLEKAEQETDEQACEAAARTLSGCRSTRRGGRRGPPLPHSNSLQDLVAALAAEPPRKHHVRHHPPPHAPQTNVSARAIHGGSLPSGVDTSSLSEEPARGAGYLATVRCVNPPPLAERRVSASDANTPAEMELLNRSKPMFPMTYTARATLEIGSGAVCSGRAVTTTTASNQVDSAISFSCITTPEVVASCNTTSSTSQAAVAVDPKPRSVISSSFNGLPLSRPNYGSTGSAATDDYKVLVAYKSIDENGNSVQGFSSPLSGSSQHKKPRRKKSTKNETLIDCQQIDGYQGDKDVNELLRFIESNADSGRGAKLSRVKHKDDSDDKTGKKRSSERRKDKESKIKRASSLEELSRTKIEDLTDAAEGSLRADKKERRDHAPAKQERRSWGDDAREPLEPPPSELTDFQTVTKKRKPRRRADEPERDPPRRARPPSPRARRESAPPSDRSNDSNDDLDSVHSLPDAPRPPTAPALPAPHASYAEIARTRHNIPDLIESCNFYAEGEGAPRPETAPPGDADGYPALDARAAAARRRDLKTAPVSSRRDRKERVAPPTEGPQAPDCPAPDVVADRRPPVILLDSAVRPRDMDGVTFGFDINEQLLSGPARRPRCDLLRDALRYVPPDAPDAPGAPGPPHQHHSHQLCQIVDYVGAAWEDVLRCGSGKVRYFNE